jgi:hypothetical protein
MLKYLPSKQRDKNANIALALSERLRTGVYCAQSEQQLRLDGHTGYCHAFLVDAIMGAILAEYASNSALPFGWRNPLPVSTQQPTLDVGPALSSTETLDLLTRMMASADSQTIQEWNELKMNLDRERTSDRKLFND